MLTGTGDACFATSGVSFNPVLDKGSMPCDAYNVGT
jgi:hypothetical protein